MQEYHDPAWLVQRAWSAFRLAALQDLVEKIIADLQRLELGDALDAGPSGLDLRAAGSPVQEALRACIEELRDASGMASAAEHRAAHCEQVRRYLAHEPSAWAEAFGAALDRYRHEASFALQRSFAASLPAATAWLAPRAEPALARPPVKSAHAAPSAGAAAGAAPSSAETRH